MIVLADLSTCQEELGSTHIKDSMRWTPSCLLGARAKSAAKSVRSAVQRLQNQSHQLSCVKTMATAYCRSPQRDHTKLVARPQRRSQPLYRAPKSQTPTSTAVWAQTSERAWRLERRTQARKRSCRCVTSVSLNIGAHLTHLHDML